MTGRTKSRAAALSLVGLTGGLADKDFDELRAIAADAPDRRGFNLDEEKRT